MKNKLINTLNYTLFSLLIFTASNFFIFKERMPYFWIFIILYVIINIFPVFVLPETKRLKTCARGNGLLIEFLGSTALSVLLFLLSFTKLLPVDNIFQNPKLWVVNTLIAILFEATVFWNGMLRVFFSSEQLGVTIRVKALVCGMIPIVHLIVLGQIIKIAAYEIEFENQKLITDRERQSQQICATKYPILMVHGVFFRDFRYFNYWGRIPKALEANGARIFYGNHQSAASVETSAHEIAERILKIAAETGCGKVNIIAHSKGGLDCRNALHLPGIAEHVATLTTINTPHRGCEFADYLLSKIPQAEQDTVAKTYNAALKKLGDPNPDFLAAVNNLTASFCKQFNETFYDVPGVVYQSVGSKLNKAAGGRFPLNFTYHLAKYFDGANDGLVGENSFPWGSSYQMLTVNGDRGISHGDMIDLNRQNIPAFDVREFYVQLAANLKYRGF
ncbi:MAG: triacylglycerol lipase [Lachnospiraceae bacterium]|nr:triacylglycerol lipase [Lachnospiraceae bacterium]MBO5145856.1 triacylglycerol lipase [Lachnospiraceae bacterium]